MEWGEQEARGLDACCSLGALGGGFGRHPPPVAAEVT